MTGARRMISIGIDPGASGAIAVLGPDTALAVHDMPVMGPRAQVNAAALADLLREATLGRPCHVWLENVHAMPRQGVALSRMPWPPSSRSSPSTVAARPFT